MDKLLEKLQAIKKSLKPGTVAGGRNMPTIKTPIDNGPKTMSSTGVQKLKGVAPGSKINPVKSAEQTQNKDIKDIKMKEAQAALKVKPLDLKKDEDSEKTTFNKLGQWSLKKDAANPKLAPKDVKVKELQEKIDTGKYKVDASKIADAMIKPPKKIKPSENN